MSDGYKQAIENMAYHISQLSERDFDPLFDKYGDEPELILAEMNEDATAVADWDNLENIADVICETYDVEYDVLYSDVWQLLVAMIFNDPEFVH
jgi:hypothetical protein